MYTVLSSSRMSLIISENTRARELLVIEGDEGVFNADMYSFWLIGPVIDELEVGRLLLVE